MAEYIERAKVTDALIDKTSIVGSGLEEAVNAICAIPAANVQQVVLCRDCKHWDIEWIPNNVKENEHFCLMVALTTRGDWFCADGEKRA